MKNAGVKRQDWKNALPNFAWVEKAGPPSVERELDKYKCTDKKTL